MLLSLGYFAIRCLLRALVLSGRGDLEREVELLVLRHQLKVLSRGARRPPFRRRDRMLLAAASQLLARHRWKAFVVTPRTCCDGTGSWSDASGHTGAGARTGQDSIRRRWGSSSEWRERTPGGATSGSEGSC
jgi:hypothetical protein